MADVLNTGTTITVAASNPKNKLRLTASLSINIFFVIYSLLCIIPTAALVMVSFSDEASIAARRLQVHGPSFQPGGIPLSRPGFRSNPAFLRHLGHCDRRQAQR